MPADDPVSEYSDPVLYDAENPDAEPDAGFYRALSAEYPGPVLDLGCGTGRVTLPLARAGPRSACCPGQTARSRRGGPGDTAESQGGRDSV